MTVALVLPFAARAASAAKATTRYFFEKSSVVFYQANGDPMRVRRLFPETTSRRPIWTTRATTKTTAKLWGPPPNLRVPSPPNSLEAVCVGQLSVGGSKLLSDHVMVNFAAMPIVFTINGGTGIFKKAKGASTHTCFRFCTPTVPSWTSYFDDTYRYTR
jgi:hypothetical protein